MRGGGGTTTNLGGFLGIGAEAKYKISVCIAAGFLPLNSVNETEHSGFPANLWGIDIGVKIHTSPSINSFFCRN